MAVFYDNYSKKAVLNSTHTYKTDGTYEDTALRIDKIVSYECKAFNLYKMSSFVNLGPSLASSLCNIAGSTLNRIIVSWKILHSYCPSTSFHNPISSLLCC